MKNSVVLTNSEFSKKAIYKSLGVKARILYPPVETKKFSSFAKLKNRNDIIIVLSRIVPYKNIENAIAVARILKQNNIGKEMRIIGNLYDDSYIIRNYYSKLLNMVKTNQLDDFISFQINLPFDKLMKTVRAASVYMPLDPGSILEFLQ